jgi:hypothetical protein
VDDSVVDTQGDKWQVKYKGKTFAEMTEEVVKELEEEKEAGCFVIMSVPPPPTHTHTDEPMHAHASPPVGSLKVAFTHGRPPQRRAFVHHHVLF